MANGIIRVIMEAAGLGRLRAAFRGVEDAARRADRAIVQSGEQATRRRLLTADQLNREMIANARSRTVAEVAADREIDRSRERLSRADRARMREEERNMRNTLRARSRLQSLSTWGAAATAVGGALVDRASGYAGAIGIPTRDEMISRFITNEQRVIRLGAAGRVDPEALNARVAEVARSTNVDPTSIIGALEVAQNRFSRLQDFADNMEAIANAANAAGGADALPDWVAALGEFQRQLGTSAEDVPALLGSMVEMMDAGSIEAADVAANFSEVMGAFRNLRGEGARGLSGSTEFLALAETLGAGGVEAPEAATQARAMFTSLSDARVRSRIEGVLGRDVFDQRGRMNISFGELASRMGEHGDVFGTPAGLERIFGHGDTRARAGWTSLIRAEMDRNADPESATRARTVGELMESSAAMGTERIATTVEALRNSTSGQAIAARIATETSFGENGEELIAMMTASGGALSQLTAEYPLATEALSTLSQVAGTLAGTFATLNLATGGGLLSQAGGGGLLSTIASSGGASLGGVIGGGLIGTALQFLFPNEAGTSEASALRDESAARYGLTPEAFDAANAAMRGMSAEERSAFQGRIEEARGGSTTVRLDAETVRALAEATGNATGRAVSSGAPADGREPGEPGRR